MKSLTYIFSILLVLTSGAFVYQEQLPTETNALFSASGNCELCHGTSNFALRDAQGNDVSPIATWQSAMLANSSNDPFWVAKVKHEGLSNPDHKEALEDVCTKCHAPMRTRNEPAPYTLDDLQGDELGQDGVSCTLCHQINGFNQNLFSGDFEINEDREIYGPFEDPITRQMFMHTGYTPVQNDLINDSRLCGSCHTLITNSVDEDGEYTGSTFIEQALYHEWENSVYNQENISCQSCHIPRIDEAVKIASRPGFAGGRQPFGLHSLTGGNFFMLNLLKNNHEELNLNSEIMLLDASIERTQDFLSQNVATIDVKEIERTSDSVYVEVTILNHAGHKFPTGFPSRRAYLEFMVIGNSDTLFHSGAKNAKAIEYSETKKFENHHELITNQEQTQIYEFVMGNNLGEVTTVLERAFEPLKDNRIPPMGFSQLHHNYDTVRVVGSAINDKDYTNESGSDRVKYALPISSLKESNKVFVLLHFETVPESWLTELFEYSAEDDDISQFKTMYSQMKNRSEIVARDSLILLGFAGY